MNRCLFMLVCAIALAPTIGCGGSDSGSDGAGGGTSGGTPGSSGSSGSCSGSFQSCTFGSLSQSQLDEFCDTALTISGAMPGTMKTCEDGTTVTINDKETCVQSYLANQKCAALAALTGKQMLDCAAAGLKDPCAVLESEACAPIKEAIPKCQ